MSTRICRAWAAGLFGLMLSACAQTMPSSMTAAPAERVVVDPYGEHFQAIEPTADHQARLVIYRDNQESQPISVKVYLNERLHVALLPGSFSETCLSPGEFDVRVALDRDTVLSERDRVSIRRLNLQKGTVLFLRLQESPNGQVFLRAQSAALAETELRNTRKQIHVLSRLKGLQDCEPATPQQASVSTVSMSEPTVMTVTQRL